MMKKMYLMKGMAVMAFGLVVASCNKMDFSDYQGVTEEQIKENAEKALGVTIDPNQTWKMTKDATANITVNETYGETYTVKIFSNNPLAEEVGYILAKGDIQNGESFKTDFSYPSGLSSIIVGITDSKGYTFYRAGKVENGILNITFGETSSAASRRSMAAPSVSSIDAPYDEAWVTNYCETATEPNNTNAWDNYDNSSYATNYGDGGVNSIDWNDPAQVADRKYFFGEDGNTDSWETRIAWALENHPTWVTYTKDADYVLNFKITSTWNGNINVVATEGLTNGVANGCERTVVVKGTWNLTDDQRVGSLGRIIVANGGKLNITSGKQLQMVNEARLVVLPGGEINGGNIEVSNGNEAGHENYNGGTINVDKFNNNFGKFYNYNKFFATEYDGGAQESNFYNHSLVKIGGTGSSANARIFNACQWYCTGDMRARNYEGIMGSALIVDGQLMFSVSEDGTTDPSYVGLAAGALVKCGTLYNNGTSWSGPTENGYAVLSMGKIVFLNWEQDHPENGGYFANNIYAQADEWTNIPGGNGYQAGETATAEYKFFNIVANAFNGGKTTPVGNGHVTKIETGNTEIIPKDNNFVKGVSGCTPGFNGGPSEEKEAKNIYSYAFEDTKVGDYDMNDVVIKAQETEDGKINLKLVAVGATLDLNIRLYPAGTLSGSEVAHYSGEPTVLSYNNQTEVHAMLGVDKGTMTNTGAGATADPITIQIDKGSYDPAHLPLAIYSESQGEMKLAGSGQAPFGVIIPIDWKWPTERVNITSAYNDVDTDEGDQSFGTFANKAGEALNWYNYPTGSVMTK